MYSIKRKPAHGAEKKESNRSSIFFSFFFLLSLGAIFFPTSTWCPKMFKVCKITHANCFDVNTFLFSFSFLKLQQLVSPCWIYGKIQTTVQIQYKGNYFPNSSIQCNLLITLLPQLEFIWGFGVQDSKARDWGFGMGRTCVRSWLWALQAVRKVTVKTFTQQKEEAQIVYDNIRHAGLYVLLIRLCFL